MLPTLRNFFQKIVKSARFILEKCARAHSKAFFRRKLSRHNTELGNFWCKSRKFVDNILVDRFFFAIFFLTSRFICRDLSIKPSCTIVLFLVLQILRNPLFSQRAAHPIHELVIFVTFLSWLWLFEISMLWCFKYNTKNVTCPKILIKTLFE